MREIKFRAWDVLDKKMVGHASIWQVISNPSGTLFKHGNHEDVIRDMVVIMQFTGLSDKNGKEIYDGDIVRYYERDNFFSDSKNKKTLRVEKIEIKLTTCLSTEDYGGPDGSLWAEDPEVIGNIYENPELLKD